MAPRLIPSQPHFASTAEERVWKALVKKLPKGSFLAANVHLHTHTDVYEADLVVGLPGQGFVVVEVKGGRVWHDDEGWWQATSDGSQSIDPAGQANRAKRLLDSYVQGQGWSHGPIRFEHMVALPDVEFDAHDPAPDLPRWALIDRNDLADAAGRVWDSLNHRITHHPAPTADWVDELADAIGGRPAPAVIVSGQLEAREEHVTRLTEQQLAVLRAVRANPAIRVSGGPGTGKTWLALERARMWATDGETVLFLCYSRGLSRWIAEAVSRMPDRIAQRITVRTFHAHGLHLGVEVPSATDQQWWDVTLPTLMLERATPEFDAVVVDEAQDFADSWWPAVLSSTRKGQLFVAGDDQQAVFAGRRGSPDLAMNHPMTEITLNENLRNSRQIASVFGPLARERMRLLGGEGPPVRFIPCAAAEAMDQADAEVERLLDAGYQPGTIAVLTTEHRHPFHVGAVEQLGKDGYWDGYWLAEEVFYSTVMGFKGLERPVVVLAIDGFHDHVGRDVMYSGLSRARDLLVVCGDLEMVRPVVGAEVCRRLGG